MIIGTEWRSVEILGIVAIFIPVVKQKALEYNNGYFDLFFYFSSNFNEDCCKIIIILDYWSWQLFYFEKESKNAQNLKFHIWKVYRILIFPTILMQIFILLNDPLDGLFIDHKTFRYFISTPRWLNVLVGLPSNLYKPITNTAWVHSRKW